MSELQIVRFPSGDVEYRVSQGQLLQVGDTLKRNGDDWVVEAVSAQGDGTVLVTLTFDPKAGRVRRGIRAVPLGT